MRSSVLRTDGRLHQVVDSDDRARGSPHLCRGEAEGIERGNIEHPAPDHPGIGQDHDKVHRAKRDHEALCGLLCQLDISLLHAVPVVIVGAPE